MGSQEKSITLGAIAEIDLQDQSIPLLLLINLDGEAFKEAFLVLGSHQLKFEQLKTGFKASYNNNNGDRLNMSELLGELIPSIAEELPSDLTVKLEQVTIAYQKVKATKPNSSKNNSALLVSSRLGFDINLNELPLIGDKIPEEINFGLRSFQLTYLSQSLNKTSATAFAKDLNINLDRFNDSNEIVLASGINISTELQIDGETQFISLPLSKPKSTQPKSKTLPKQNSPDSEDSPPKPEKQKSITLSTQSTQNITELWLELNKKIGPISLQKIGVQYRSEQSELWFFLNAGLSIGGLTLACNNLAVGSSLKEFKPKFSLDGISIHYRGSDAIEIGGAFLRKIRHLEDGTPYEEYSGGVIIGFKLKNKKLTFTAIGSYTEINGEASLFVFALLDFPLGGPPCFFVTGLAAGFGYNRNLKAPETVEDVAKFPLIRLAMGEPPSKSTDNSGEVNLLSVLDDLGPYIPPAKDEMFFAVGIKFTSFKLIEAFVLLIIKLGKKLEIYILGLATLTAPPILEGVSDSIEPVAQARLAIKAVFIPEDGILHVEAILAEGSYIFSKKCYLTGGFALYCWFSGEHEGDFVLSLGGYHPEFQIPDHYPRVPPVQLSWELDQYLSIKGYAYFALTPSALMVGGGLEASFRKDDIQAHYKIEAHFIVAWQPFFYSANISVEIKASAKIKVFGIKKTISLNIGANLKIWGPPFSGCAQLQLGPIEIKIYFGDSEASQPKPLTWSEFEKSLLPAEEEVCSLSISDGLIEKIGEGKQEIWIVNAKDLVITTESVIPSSNVKIREKKSNIAQRNKEIGIRPMGVPANEFEATYKISIVRSKEEVNQEFKFVPIYKNVPSAIWKSSERLTPGQHEEKLIKNALSGFEIRAASQPKPGQTKEIEYEKLLADECEGSKYCWNTIETLDIERGKTPDQKNTIQYLEKRLEEQINQQRRQNLLESLELNSTEQEITISKAFAEELFGDCMITA